MKTRNFFRFCGFLALLAAVLPAGCDRSPPGDGPAALSKPVAAPAVSPPPALEATQQSFIAVSERVTPAVVNISAARRRAQPEFGPLFEQFFGGLFPERPRARRQEQSLGSGFIITPDGHLMTNAHVVAGAEEIRVTLSDQRSFPARLVGSDERTDVAVLRIEGEGPFETATLGDSERIRVGQWALAIGNPFGLDRTVTVGVISATGRSNVGIEEYEDFLQTDASINPGNSGGPLLDIQGNVVGINTAIVASGQGIGFAIPINLARDIAAQLIENGTVQRGWLGVRIQPLTPELAATFGYDRATGALVTEVLKGSPADRAGLRQGDILLTFGGREVRGVRPLQLLVASSRPGEKVEVEILRGGERRTVTLEVIARSEEAVSAAQPAGDDMGFEVRQDEQGVRVVSVDAESEVVRAGLRPGDLLLQYDGRDTPTLEAFAAARRAAAGKQAVRLLVQRGDSVMYLAFTRR